MSGTQPSLPTPQPVPRPQFQPLQPNNGFPQWKQPLYPPQPETYYQPQAPVSMPVLPPMPPPRKPRTRSFIMMLVVVTLLLISALAVYSVASHSTDATPTPDVQATTNATISQGFANDQLTQAAINATDAAGYTPAPQPTPTSTNDIGQSGQSGYWLVTVNSLKTTQGDPYLPPKAGNTYLLINATAKDTDTSNHTISVIDFSLRDSQGNSYPYTFATNTQALSGDVVAGQQLRGYLGFEIPKSLHAVILQFNPSFDASQVVQWNLSV